MGILHRLFGGSVFRASEDRWLQRLGWVRPPEAVQWISSSVCDLHCPHCYSHAGRKGKNELTTHEAKHRIIDELVRLDRPTFVIAGGEALLRPDFGEIVSYAAERRVPWAIHTHGGHVPKWSSVFADHPPVMAAISLDGPRELHDRFRGRAGSFDRAIDAMRIVKEAGCPEVVAGTTITRQNADHLIDLVPTIMDSAADSWGFHLMTPEGRASEHRELLATPAQLRRVASLARRLRSILHVELDNEWGSAGDDDCFYRDAPFSCGAGRISCVVSATGEVMPCTTTDLDESQGNVRGERLSDIWARGFDAFRKESDAIEADCDDCWLNTRHGHSCRSAFGYSVPSLVESEAVL